MLLLKEKKKNDGTSNTSNVASVVEVNFASDDIVLVLGENFEFFFFLSEK